MSGKGKKPNPALEAFRAGWGLVEQNPVLGPLARQATPHFDDSYPMAKEDWAWVDANGNVYANSHRRAAPQAWAYVSSPTACSTWPWGTSGRTGTGTTSGMPPATV